MNTQNLRIMIFYLVKTSKRKSLQGIIYKLFGLVPEHKCIVFLELLDEIYLDSSVGSHQNLFADLADVRGMLDRRYDEVKSGKVKPRDGEAFFENLRRREDELIKQRSPR